MADRNSSDTADLEFSLEENAEDSLSHGVHHFLEAKESGDPSDLKYTILHTFHATELYLKARLVKAHPSLIFQKPEDAQKDDPKTVDFDTLVARLKAVSVQFKDGEIEDLNRLRKVRNRIEHHRISFSLEEAQDYVGRAMRFLDRFLGEELSISLKENLDEETYKALSEALYSYEERLEKAVASASEDAPYGKDAMDWELIECPDCGEATMPPSPESDGKCRCHFCNARYFAESCTRCGRAILYLQEPNEDNWQAECDDCLEYRMSRDD